VLKSGVLRVMWNEGWGGSGRHVAGLGSAVDGGSGCVCTYVCGERREKELSEGGGDETWEST
jgi:hypothetical protein